MTSNDEYVIQILVERGFLTQDQVAAAAKSMKAENETTLDVLVAGGTIGEDEVLGTVADQFGLKYCHVNADAIDTEVTKEIPADIAKKYGVVYSKCGNGICHQLHLERFGRPRKTDLLCFLIYRFPLSPISVIWPGVV